MATSWIVRKAKSVAISFAWDFVPRPVRQVVQKVKKTEAKPKGKAEKKAAAKQVGPKVKVPPPPAPHRSKVIRRAKMEWSKEGERLVPEIQHPGIHWTDHFVAPEDQDLYRGLVQSCWVEFAAWPNEAGDIEALHKAVLERAVWLYGEYALSWAVQDIQLIESAADRAAAKAETEEAPAP